MVLGVLDHPPPLTFLWRASPGTLHRARSRHRMCPGAARARLRTAQSLSEPRGSRPGAPRQGRRCPALRNRVLAQPQRLCKTISPARRPEPPRQPLLQKATAPPSKTLT